MTTPQLDSIPQPETHEDIPWASHNLSPNVLYAYLGATRQAHDAGDHDLVIPHTLWDLDFDSRNLDKRRRSTVETSSEEPFAPSVASPEVTEWARKYIICQCARIVIIPAFLLGSWQAVIADMSNRTLTIYTPLPHSTPAHSRMIAELVQKWSIFVAVSMHVAGTCCTEEIEEASGAWTAIIPLDWAFTTRLLDTGLLVALCCGEIQQSSLKTVGDFSFDSTTLGQALRRVDTANVRQYICRILEREKARELDGDQAMSRTSGSPRVEAPQTEEAHDLPVASETSDKMRSVHEGRSTDERSFCFAAHMSTDERMMACDLAMRFDTVTDRVPRESLKLLVEYLDSSDNLATKQPDVGETGERHSGATDPSTEDFGDDGNLRPWRMQLRILSAILDARG